MSRQKWGTPKRKKSKRKAKRVTKKVSELSVLGLQKLYGRKVAVRDVSFAMDPGEVVGLLGPNGAGKTTVFFTIVGFIKPTKGTILLGGRNITGWPMYKRARAGIAYLPQEPSVFRRLTVEKNIWAILETRDDITQEQKKEKLEELLDDLGIRSVRRQKAYTLSGGERRRTEIARSLAMDPQFLLMDEPFAGIDPKAVYEIKRIVQSLSGAGIGVLITDHNVRDTLEITGRSYIIDLGQIVVSGTRQELLESRVAREIYLGHDFRM
jgi:lipopolysaccharide export system ATP-binding protein